MNRKQRRAAAKADTRVPLGNTNTTHKLAETLIGQGQFDAAIPLLLAALRQNPGLPEAWSDLGLAYEHLNRADEAIVYYTKALQVQPNFAIAQYNLCRLLRRRGRFAEAIEHARRVLRLHPEFVLGHILLGGVMLDMGRKPEALSSATEALRLSPGQADALELMASALHHMDRDEDAIEAYRRALAARPGSASLLRNLGQILQANGRPDEAIAVFAEAVRLDPGPVSGWLQLAYAKLRAADWAELDLCERQARERLRADPGATPPFLLVGVMRSSAAEQSLAAKHWADRTLVTIAPLPKRAPHGGGRIRIGYLSADFRWHATASLITGVFERHDRDRFEIFAYSIGPDDGSADRRRLEEAVDHFVDLSQLPYEQAARRIQADGIDILLDLNGYVNGARTEILAYRPAPIQVNYLGYPGTMGAGFIDYILVDPVVVPPESAPFFSEKLVHLPDCYQPNMHRDIAPPGDTRADHGLPETGFVFCCFNQIYKITPPLFTIWMRLLRSVPGSVLWLLSAHDFTLANFRREAVARGVDPARLIFARVLPSADHLARLRHADLFVDTLPYCAHTTASDALWAGLPLVSCMGETFPSRVASSLLMAMGLDDLVTSTLAAYEALALKLALDTDSLASVRRRVWAARSTSALFDTKRMTRHIEQAFGTMWQRHQAGAAPESFAVAALP
jgi:predicted O-linked N-acetylglucosamine transferase (SPINDLY family)